jgi:hypothetical protein
MFIRSVTKFNYVIEFSDEEDGVISIHTSLMFRNDNTTIDIIRIAYDNLKNVINEDKLEVDEG